MLKIHLKVSKYKKRTIISLLIAPLVVAIVSWFTMMRGYNQPDGFFWDESYHIASAQKYLNYIFFMEPHPPLGKLLIAAGEALFDANLDDSLFIDTSQAKDPPKELNLTGYRFFPALLGWLSATLFYFILLLITNNSLLSLGISSFYIFDNAIIVHNRGAMLEGIQIFFALATLLSSLMIEKVKKFQFISCAIAGIFFACTINTKVNGFIFIIPTFFCIWRSTAKNWLSFFKLSLCTIIFSVAISILIWGITFSFSYKINPKLENNGYFTAKKDLIEILKTDPPASFSIQVLYMLLRDSYTFFNKYERGVPKLNVCKESENGSYPLLWPLGSSSINYRSNTSGNDQQYLYLIPNPIIWIIALFGVIFAVSIALCRISKLIPQKIPRESYLFLWLAMYITYMLLVLNVPRVLYLYHYFIPLILCHLMIAELSTGFIKDKIPTSRANTIKRMIGISLPFLGMASFFYFKPLTYFEKIKKTNLEKYAWLDIWDVVCNGCESINPIGRPISENNAEQIAKKSFLYLSGIKSTFVSQEWGEPRVNMTADGQSIIIAGEKFDHGFGVHAFSRIVFPVNRNYSYFNSFIGMPDYTIGKEGSVVFQVYGDGKLIAQSSLIRPGTPKQSIQVMITGISELILQVKDGGNGIDYDHAIWADPRLLP